DGGRRPRGSRSTGAPRRRAAPVATRRATPPASAASPAPATGRGAASMRAAGDSGVEPSGLPAADEPHLGLQPYPTPLPPRPLGSSHQCLHIRSSRTAIVHDEVGVPLREAGPPDAPALQTRCLDQATRVVAARVLEDRPRVRLSVRLAREAALAHAFHAR